MAASVCVTGLSTSSIGGRTSAGAEACGSGAAAAGWSACEGWVVPGTAGWTGGVAAGCSTATGFVAAAGAVWPTAAVEMAQAAAHRTASRRGTVAGISLIGKRFDNNSTPNADAARPGRPYLPFPGRNRLGCGRLMLPARCTRHSGMNASPEDRLADQPGWCSVLTGGQRRSICLGAVKRGGCGCWSLNGGWAPQGAA